MADRSHPSPIAGGTPRIPPVTPTGQPARIERHLARIGGTR